MLAVNFFIWFMALCWISGFDKIESQRGGAFGRVFLLLVTSMPHMKKGYAQGRDLYNRIERLQQDLVAPPEKEYSGRRQQYSGSFSGSFRK